jgi:hypothetical protein
VASFGPPRCVRAATGSLVDGFEPRIRELLRPFPRMPATANRGGSASRGDSLIEFVKTNVAILPLLILTATTNGDELSYGLKRHCGGWFLDRLELGVDRRRAVG